ncbi:MAG: hypothetical protein QJR02_11470 [Sinobacteraceae bacterium]|nr:hypothetical protein [Nevskiaceae bacterium]
MRSPPPPIAALLILILVCMALEGLYVLLVYAVRLSRNRRASKGAVNIPPEDCQ